MIHPRFMAGSFWNYGDTCELVGAKYPAPPLGLITVAAMLPDTWEIRLIDRNTAELEEADLNWADIVLTGGMLPQQGDTLQIVRTCRAKGIPVAVGGPDPTTSPELYEDADFRIIGEAEGVIGEFLSAWENGTRSGTFTAEKFKADVTATPAPRFDLLNFENYVQVSVQFSAAARSPANSATSSSFTAGSPAPRTPTRCWPNWTGSMTSATAAMSISSTTT